MSLYHFPAARSEEQLKMMKDLEARKVCIFCPEHIHAEDFSQLQIETDHWMVKNNSFPYKHTRVHILLIPKVHIATMTELPPEAQLDLFKVLKQCERKFKLHSYGFVVRSGDMRHNGGSIEHLHVHVVAGDTDDPDHEPVRFKVSSKP